MLGRGGAVQPGRGGGRWHRGWCQRPRAASRSVSNRLSVYGDAAITLGLPFVAGGVTGAGGVPQHPP